MKLIRTVVVLLYATICVASLGVVKAQLTDCREVVTIRNGDSLKKLSNDFYGSDTYDRAILLATNSETGSSSESGFRYISDPYKLPVGGKACIPPQRRADELRVIEDTYRAAVAEMVLPTPSDVSDALVSIDMNHPIRLVTWKPANQLALWKNPDGSWKTEAASDIWVTVVPRLKSFCQAFVKAHHSTAAELSSRIEQRLGLPPGSNNDVFVEMTIKEPLRYGNLFRPCINPSVAAKTCQLGPFPEPLPEDISEKHRAWIYGQYYNSYAVAEPNQYPWTALGYTFDWAADETGRSRFVRVGESEFVVPKGASIEISGSPIPTAEYCSVQ